MQNKSGLIFALLLTTFLFALHDATLKYLSAYFAVPLLVWSRYVIQLAIMLVAVAPSMGRELFATERPWPMLFRAFMQVCNALCVQLALKYMPLAETTALIFMTPLLVVLLAGPILGERHGFHHWLAILAGFLGVILIARPGGAVMGIGVAYAFAATICHAMYQLFTRKLANSEPPMRQLFFSTIVGATCMSFTLPEYWTGEIPSPIQAGLLISASICVAVGHFLYIRAAGKTPAATLATLLYLKLIWAIVLGMLVFRQIPDYFSVIGMVVICAAGFAIVLVKPAASKAVQN